MPLNFCHLHKFLVVLICTAFLANVSAKELRISNLLSEELPSEFVTDITQLSNGFLLFSTQNGARLYDGYRLIKMGTDQQNEITPLDSYIYDVLEASNGEIWFATAKGLYRFDPRTRKLEDFFKNGANDTQLVNQNVRKVLEDSNGTLWFGTLNGISAYNPTLKKFTNFQIADSPNKGDNLIGRIYELIEHENKIWVGSSKGLFYIASGSLQLKRLPGTLGKKYITSGIVYNEQSLWFGTDTSGLFQLDTRNFQFTQIQKNSMHSIQLSSNSVWSVYKDSNQRIWIGYWNDGASLFDPKDTQNYTFPHRSNDNTTLPSYSVQTFIEDRSGLIWIATTSGAASFNPNTLLYKSIHHIPGKSPSISSSALITAIKDQQGDIWIGSEQGLDRWTPTNNQVKSFRDFNFNGKTQSDLAVWKIQPFDGDELLLATQDGIKRFNKKTGKSNTIENLLDMHGKPVDYSFYELLSLGNGQFITASSFSTVHKIDLINDTTELLFDSRQSPQTTETEYYASIQLDNKDGLWLGSTTGVHRYDLESQEVMVFNSKDQHHKINADIIYDMELQNNLLWVATSSGGIVTINIDDFSTRSITQLDGLPSNEVLSLFITDNETVWFSTRDHVGEINVKTLDIKINSLLSQTQGSYAEDGAWVGDNNEIILISDSVINLTLDKLKLPTLSAPIRISEISRLHQQENRFNPFSNVKRISFDPEDTLVTFNFSAFDFAYSNLIQYRYKLEGHDKKWLNPGNKSSASYTHLPSGQYRFKIQSTDRNGTWGEEVTALNITVTPYWWKSHFAFAVYLITALLILFLILNKRKEIRLKEKLSINAIRRSESRMKDILWGSGDELWRWHLITNKVYVTSNMQLNDSPDEKIEQLNELIKRVHPDDKSSASEMMRRHLNGKIDHFESQYRIMDSERNKWRWVLSRGRVVESSADGTPLVVAGTTKDIDELKRTERQLRYLANYDQLTGLPNRSLFLEHLNHSIKLADRFKEKIALLFLDLDSFKMINDTLGHSIGDQLLQSVAQRLQDSLRGTDNLARLSGDEFAIIIERINDSKEVEPTLSRLITELNQPFDLPSQSLATSVSVGVAIYPDNANSPAQLLKHADIAMYQAKKKGKKQYQYFHPDMNALLEKRIDMEHELELAIKEKQFEAYYQARADVSDNSVKGFETLIRWFHPEKGMVSPAEFIPIAEETGQILEIGEIILEKACIQAAKWYKNNWRGCVSVNIAALQFQQSDLVSSVKQALENTGLPANHLELEITEGTLIKNIEHTRNLLLRLKEIGVKIALDDFGTGYSSLSYLQQLPIDVLKIDRSFILEITHSNKAAQLSKAIINMAHSLGLTVVAEGIEETTQLEFLKQSGCEEYQGFLFGRPVPANEITIET